MIRVACILPKFKNDYLVNTVLDGLAELATRGEVSFFVAPSEYSHPAISAGQRRTEERFLEEGREADVVLFFWGKNNTDDRMAGLLDVWHKTVFVDGSEVGHNDRYDACLQKQIFDFSFQGNGAVSALNLKKCAAYFRREKPYLHGIAPFPFGIERRYVKWKEGVKKDIDFTCVFGQETYPPLRRYVREALENFCLRNGFICHTARTKNQDEFYNILARSKVGISVGGGGFDTARFWEILGNNCLLLTETIDIYPKDSQELDYERIHEFGNLYDFEELLSEMSSYLRNEYRTEKLSEEYLKIMEKHSTRARVENLLSLSLKEIQKRSTQKDRCAVVISSCDAYSDLWEPFFTLFFRYWPDCPFPIYLISNNLIYPDSRVKTLPVGNNMSWAKDVFRALSVIPADFILYLQDDYFLQSKVETPVIEKLLEVIASQSIATIRLVGSPEPDIQFGNPFGLGGISKEAEYRVSLQAGLWRREIFRGLLKEDENPWEMEKNGSKRSQYLSEYFLSASGKKGFIPYYRFTGLKKGKWVPGALTFLKKEGISIDVCKRGVCSSRIRFWASCLKDSSIAHRIRRVPIVGKIGAKMVNKIYKHI